MARITPAEGAIRQEIAREKRITFRRFMELAMYEAPGAYYASSKARIGAAGDYFTSPEVHPAFGALVARQAEQLWVNMDRPDSFDAVEMGAGRGALARDVLSYVAQWAPELYPAVRYSIVERYQQAADLQKATLLTAGFDGKVTWLLTDSFDLPNKVEGCFISNELLDALPVHQVRVLDGELEEVYVESVSGNLVTATGPLSDPRLAEYFGRLGFLPPEGCRAEVNLAALDWMARVGEAMRRGAVMTFDYGYPAEELYSQRHCDGTLLCFYRHTLNDDPFARIGEQDMTAHVDFTSLAAAGLQHGLKTLGLTSQSAFLSALGMDRYIAALPSMGLRARDLEANRLGMAELLKPDGLGRVRVLLQQKGLDRFDPAGLRATGLAAEHLGRDWSTEPPPLLTHSHMRLNAPPQTVGLLDEESMWRELMEGQEEG